MLIATCSRSCRFADLPDGAVSAGVEQQRPMADQLLWLGVDDSATVRFSTTSANGWWRDGDNLVLEVDHLVQPTIRTTRLRVRVTVPDGYEVATAPGGAQVQDSDVVWAEPASGRMQFTCVFAPVDRVSG